MTTTSPILPAKLVVYLSHEEGGSFVVYHPAGTPPTEPRHEPGHWTSAPPDVAATAIETVKVSALNRPGLQWLNRVHWLTPSARSILHTPELP